MRFSSKYRSPWGAEAQAGTKPSMVVGQNGTSTSFYMSSTGSNMSYLTRHGAKRRLLRPNRTLKKGTKRISHPKMALERASRIRIRTRTRRTSTKVALCSTRSDSFTTRLSLSWTSTRCIPALSKNTILTSQLCNLSRQMRFAFILIFLLEAKVRL